MKTISIRKISKKQIIIAGIATALIGTALTLYSRAETAYSLLFKTEGETMQSSPDFATVYSDSGASGGKAINIFSDGTISSPTFSTTDTTVKIEVVAKGTRCSGRPQMVVKVDGRQQGSTITVGARSWSTYAISTSVPAGNHSVSVNFPNDYWQKGTCDRNLYVDKVSLLAATPLPSDVTPPVASITLPASGATVTGPMTINATASDNVSVKKVEFYVDSTLVSTSLNAPYTFSGSSTSYANGAHTLEVRAYDPAGNIGIGKTSIYISNTVATTPTPSVTGSNIGYFPKATSFVNPVTNPVVRTDSAAFMQQFVAGGFWNPNFSIGAYGVAVVTGTGQFSPFPAPPPAEGYQYLGSSGKFSVPKVPAGTKPVTGTDGHLAVISGQTVYEFFKATVSADGTITNAKAVARADLNGNGQTNTTDAPSDAAGLSLLAGLVTPEEMASGHIDHALVFSVPGIKSGPAIFPAWENVFVSGPNTVLVEGSKIQLDPAADISSLTGPERVIAKALQTHGAYLRDNGGTFAIYGETTTRWPASYGTGGSIPIKNIPWSKIRVIN